MDLDVVWVGFLEIFVWDLWGEVNVVAGALDKTKKSWRIFFDKIACWSICNSLVKSTFLMTKKPMRPNISSLLSPLSYIFKVCSQFFWIWFCDVEMVFMLQHGYLYFYVFDQETIVLWLLGRESFCGWKKNFNKKFRKIFFPKIISPIMTLSHKTHPKYHKYARKKPKIRSTRR